METNCGECMYYEYDAEFDEYCCSALLDEDDAERFMTGRTRSCPFFTPGDEYSIVKKQN